VSPSQTLQRFSDAGVSEIIVKDGENPTVALSQGQDFMVETPSVPSVCDTSGAGDAFNAGYLAGRLLDQTTTKAIGSGQKLSAEVICHFGARIPKGHVPSIE
jgi:2-dehydro-3-deoxygluconokinase